MDWAAIGFLKASSVRLAIFKTLIKGPRTPREIRIELDIHFSQVSKCLSEIESHGLVVCKNETSRKGRLYSLSKHGEEIAKTVAKVSGWND